MLKEPNKADAIHQECIKSIDLLNDCNSQMQLLTNRADVDE